jgi:hypothetical protein
MEPIQHTTSREIQNSREARRAEEGGGGSKEGQDFELSETDLADPSVRRMIDIAKQWSQGHEVSPMNVGAFIYHLVLNAYNLFGTKEGLERKRLVLGIVWYSVMQKDDWPSPEKRQRTLDTIRDVGNFIVNSNSINVKQMANTIWNKLKECPCCVPTKEAGMAELPDKVKDVSTTLEIMEITGLDEQEEPPEA